MSHEVLIKKEWTRSSILAAHEAGGRKKGRPAGGWVDDLAQQKKVITLCSACQNKFNPGRVGFKREKEFPYTLATCDGCSVKNAHCAMYIYAETYATVRSTENDRRAWCRRFDQFVQDNR